MGWLDAYDRHAGNAASGNQLGFELGAVGAAASAGLGVLVVGVHVSTVCYVDTMLLHPRRQCQMGWPDAYETLCGTLLMQKQKAHSCNCMNGLFFTWPARQGSNL